jgi:threonine aldolase
MMTVACTTLRAALFYLAVVSKSTVALASSRKPPLVHLQRPHVLRSPAETLRYLAQECERFGIDAFDVYGDFDADAAEDSFLKRFESEIAQEFGLEDAVFMPSGVMAQSIALLIHQAASKDQQGPSACFACHESSHLLLHEQHAYRELLHMDPIVISTVSKAKGISIPPMMLDDVKDTLDQHIGTRPVSTLILELPHREIGGKLTPWEDVLKIQAYCHGHGIKFHLDGARIFEATTGYNHTLKELACVFDSVYISFYKGLGGISGAMLLGSNEFCNKARIWLRRFGGNLYTLLPYAVSGWSGYRRYWRLERNNHDKDSPASCRILSFQEKKDKLVGLVKALSADISVSQVLAFDPAIPETNMAHGFIRASPEDCRKVIHSVEERLHVTVLSRVRAVDKNESAHQLGFQSKFEWAIGEANGYIADETFLQCWRDVAAGLLLETNPS